MKKIAKSPRLSWWLTGIIILLGGLVVLAIHFDTRLYQQPLAKVVKVQSLKTTATTDEFKNHDHYHHQQLTLQVLNGRYRGRILKTKNTYTDSGAMDQAYRQGQAVILQARFYHGHPTNIIQGAKRDTSIAFIFWVAISLLLAIMQFSGFLALLSVLLNATLFYFAIQLNLALNGNHVYLTFGVLAVVFAALTLLIVIGPNWQMVITFVATAAGTCLAVLISLAVFRFTHERGVTYESMQYVTQVPRPLFLVETVLGSLGAVMDESTDIVASLRQLKRERPLLAAHQIFNSGIQIGRSIMGPLVNVLFLIFMADTFAMSVLYLRNGNSWGYTFTMNMSLGMVQSLISGIGIVLAIPVASWLASRLLRAEVSHD